MALTAGHVFRAGEGTEVYASAPHGDSWTYVGTLSRPKSHDDVAAIELAPQTAFDVGEDGAFNTLAPSLSLLGRTVFRRRADGTRVQGCITELAQGVPLKTDGEVGTLQEALVVRGDMTDFANRGDSGSLVRLDTNEVLGMVVGGNSESTLVAPIARALNEIGGRLAQVSGSGKAVIAEPSPSLELSSADEPREIRARAGQGTFASIKFAPELFRYKDTLATAEADLSIIPASGVRAPRLFYVPRFIQWARHHGSHSVDAVWGRTVALQTDGSPDRATLGAQVLVSFQDLDRVIHGRPVALAPAVLSGIALSKRGPGPETPIVPDWILPIEDQSRGSWGYKPHIERRVVDDNVLSEIVPAIYVLDGLDQIAGQSWKQELRGVEDADVFDDGNARNWAALVAEMQQGRFVTSQTAHVVRSFLVRMGSEVGKVRMADPYALRHGRAAYNERVVRKYMFRG
jgi:hypothetical protein